MRARLRISFAEADHVLVYAHVYLKETRAEALPTYRQSPHLSEFLQERERARSLPSPWNPYRYDKGCFDHSTVKLVISETLDGQTCTTNRSRKKSGSSVRPAVTATAIKTGQGYTRLTFVGACLGKRLREPTGAEAATTAPSVLPQRRHRPRLRNHSPIASLLPCCCRRSLPRWSVRFDRA